jgi:hypothetical protein
MTSLTLEEVLDNLEKNTERAEKLIAALPDSSLGIALKLLELGIKGKKSCADGCPMSVFFRENDLDTSVTDTYVLVWTPDSLHNSSIPGQPSFVQFVKDFDSGKYPELDLYPEEKPYCVA